MWDVKACRHNEGRLVLAAPNVPLHAVFAIWVRDPLVPSKRTLQTIYNNVEYSARSWLDCASIAVFTEYKLGTYSSPSIAPDRGLRFRSLCYVSRSDGVRALSRIVCVKGSRM